MIHKPRRRSPALALTMLGAASAAVYLAYVRLYPLITYAQASQPLDLEKLSRSRPWAAYVYVLGLGALFVLFWRALRIVQGAHVPLRLVLFFGILFGLILVWLYPITANDLFRYVLRARLRVVYGANPYLVPLSDFPDDPLLSFAGEWAGHLSPYGPAWELLAEGVARLGFQGLVSGALAYKVVVLLAYLACTGLLIWGTKGDAQAVLLFAWNPLVLIQGPGNGHNDLLMLAWALLGLLFWERKRSWALAVVGVTLAVLTKLAAALLAPLLMIAVLRGRRGWWRRAAVLLGAGGLALVVTVLSYIPFWPIWESLSGVLEELSRSYTYTIAALLRMILRELMSNEVALAISRTLVGESLSSDQLSRLVFRAVGRVIFLVYYLWALVRLWQRRLRLAEAGFLVYFVYLLTATGYRIWYPLWLVPLAALHLTPRARLRTFLFSLTSELSILMFYLVWRWLLNGVVLFRADWLVMHIITVPWQYGLPLLLPLRRPRGALGKARL